MYFFIVRSSMFTMSQPESAAYNYACEDCGRTFSSMEELARHQSKLHSKSIGTAQT